MSESHRDQRVVIKFYCLRKKLITKTHEKMKAVYDDVCLSQATVFSWYKMSSHEENQQNRNM